MVAKLAVLNLPISCIYLTKCTHLLFYRPFYLSTFVSCAGDSGGFVKSGGFYAMIGVVGILFIVVN